MQADSFLADFHVHTNMSDGKHPIEEVVDLYGRLGFGAIAITDHIAEESTLIGRAAQWLGQVVTPCFFDNYLEILHQQAKRAWTKYSMRLIPGFELSKNSISNHRSAHILGLGVSEFIAADGPVETLCEKIRSQGALTVAAHPVWTRKREKQTYYLWDNREALKTSFDAWEVASGPFLFNEVAQGCFPMIASSDLHHKRQIRAWKTRLTCERELSSILDAIRAQDVTFEFYAPPSTVHGLKTPLHPTFDQEILRREQKKGEPLLSFFNPS